MPNHPKPKPKPKPITKDGQGFSLETRLGEEAVVMHCGLQQWRFDAVQARLLARELRKAAKVIDPEPDED